MAAAAALLCSGCLFPLSGLSEGLVVRTDVGDVLMKWQPNNSLDEARSQKAIERAAPKLLRWGKLDQAVTFYLLPSHLRLESAVNAFGYSWLHAWARYDVIYFESPSLWNAAQPDIDELVLHELTHCLMYQRSATLQSWEHKEIPTWFREGMATWTADQGYKFPALEDLARFYEQNPEADPIAGSGDLYEENPGIVYSAAHHGFTFFVRRHGEPTVHRLMASMSEGRTFPDAFLAVTGITSAAFAREFRHYVIWRGFRGHGKKKSLP